jgi:uncharacterized protein (DUF1499 family)
MRHHILEEPVSRLAVWSRRCAFLALPIAGFGLAFGRFGFTELPNAVAVFVFALLMAVLALVLAGFAFVGIWNTGQKGAAQAMTAVALALALLAWPTLMIVRSIDQPSLNDITTDIDAPPAFSAEPKVVAARGGFVPSAIGRSQREAQLKAYPQVQPINLDVDVTEAFASAEAALKTLGWKEIDGAAPIPHRADGRLEVRARSLLMGIPYSISVRIRTAGEGSRVDVRSLSRLGAHDFGANADNIQTFAAALQAELDAS